MDIERRLEVAWSCFFWQYSVLKFRLNNPYADFEADFQDFLE